MVRDSHDGKHLRFPALSQHFQLSSADQAPPPLGLLHVDSINMSTVIFPLPAPRRLPPASEYLASSLTSSGEDRTLSDLLENVLDVGLISSGAELEVGLDALSSQASTAQ